MVTENEILQRCLELTSDESTQNIAFEVGKWVLNNFERNVVIPNGIRDGVGHWDYFCKCEKRVYKDCNFCNKCGSVLKFQNK